MIPKNTDVTIKRTSLDAWGIRVPNGVTETIRCYVSYKIEMRGNEVNTNRPSLESVPVGNMFFTGLVKVSYEDELSWTSHDGKVLRVNADAVDYIVDSNGKVVFTKVKF